MKIKRKNKDHNDCDCAYIVMDILLDFAGCLEQSEVPVIGHDG